MKFVIEPAIFNRLPNLCIGVVVAKDIDNRHTPERIQALLARSIANVEQQFSGVKVKESAAILPYREAFQQLSINPNKFMCSIEALFTRIAKGKGMPSINPLVDLNNAISLKYHLPMGTHDLSLSDDDVMLRFANENDRFIPFGSDAPETPEQGELIYAVGNQVRTRRWTWRQSEIGKIDENTNYVFFPIDGFVGVNDDQVKAAIDELSTLLATEFHAEVKAGWLDKDNTEMDLGL
ncbi:hypothetical protein HYE66_09140 [Aggregatibacter actinomycetemcomitans]|nr:hypothetical protein [Aggregatibacter actinomycetemcomitans]